MKHMKRYIKIVVLLIIALACSNGTKAQRRKVLYLQNYEQAPYHFGFLIGINFMGLNLDLKENYQNEIIPKNQFPDQGTPLNNIKPFSQDAFDHYQIQSIESRKLTRNPGFSVGVIGDLLLGRFFNLRFSPTLSLSWRQVYYDVTLYDVNGQKLNTGGDQIVHSRDDLATYMEFPLHIKYRSERYNNVGAYLLVGFNPKLYLVSRQNKTSSNGSPQYLVPKRADIALEIGAGYDIYNQWFKMGVEVKMGFGLCNLIPTDSASQTFLYARAIESLKNNQLQLSFTFE